MVATDKNSATLMAELGRLSFTGMLTYLARVQFQRCDHELLAGIMNVRAYRCDGYDNLTS